MAGRKEGSVQQSEVGKPVPQPLNTSDLQTSFHTKLSKALSENCCVRGVW